MPRPRFEKAAPELKQAILTAARKEFAEQGYETASLNKILETAGLSKGAFYYYFDDKADLAITVILDVYGPLLVSAPLPDPKSGDEFWSTLDAYMRRTLDQIESDPEKMALISKVGSLLLRDPQLAKRMVPLVAQQRQEYGKLWAKGAALGAVRTDLSIPVQMALIQALKESLGRALLPHDRAPTTEELEHFSRVQMDLIRRVCEPQPDAKDPP